jgi:CTP:molybdopterin cytidylyltransferase MocA
MGEPKGLIDVGGNPWLAVQIERFHDLGGKDVIVVLGYDKELYSPTVSRVISADPLVSTVINQTPEYGPFTSITCAARTLKAKGAFVLPVDVPVPDKQVWANLVEAFAGQVRVCVPMFEGTGGHPVLLGLSFLEELMRLPVDSPESRLDLQIRKLPANQTAKVPVRDNRILRNMNTISDLEGVA